MLLYYNEYKKKKNENSCVVIISRELYRAAVFVRVIYYYIIVVAGDEVSAVSSGFVRHPTKKRDFGKPFEGCRRVSHVHTHTRAPALSCRYVQWCIIYAVMR